MRLGRVILRGVKQLTIDVEKRLLALLLFLPATALTAAAAPGAAIGMLVMW